MEETLKTVHSASLSDVAHLRHRQPVPDVPENVEDELMHHFNDPNWDFQANSSTVSISTDGVEPTRMGASTDVDTESQVSTWRIHDSKADFVSEESQFQCVSSPRSLLSQFVDSLYLIRDSPYPEVRAAVANTDDPDMVVNTFRV